LRALEALRKQILFIFELGVEAGLIDSSSQFQFVKTGVSNPVSPKKPAAPSLTKTPSRLKFFGRPIASLSIDEPIGAKWFLTRQRA
jgi:hypothetical protein